MEEGWNKLYISEYIASSTWKIGIIHRARFLSDLIAPYLYDPIGVLQNMNTEHTNSQLNDIFPRSFLKNRRVAPRRPLYLHLFIFTHVNIFISFCIVLL